MVVVVGGAERVRRNEPSFLSPSPRIPLPLLGSFSLLGGLFASLASLISTFPGSAGLGVRGIRVECFLKRCSHSSGPMCWLT